MPTPALCQHAEGKSRQIALAATMQGLAVALGAFGAHGLRTILENNGRISTWETAVLYHLMHGTALLALAIWTRVDPAAAHSRALRAVAWLWTVGIVLFSGSLYALALGGPRWLGPVTPLGGVCFLAGWTALAIAGWRGITARHTDA